MNIFPEGYADYVVRFIIKLLSEIIRKAGKELNRLFLLINPGCQYCLMPGQLVAVITTGICCAVLTFDLTENQIRRMTISMIDNI